MIKVALCDDIIDYNKKMESYIEKYGNENHVEVKITSYGSGSQLLLNYQKRKFDVIFLDVSMPEMDGFETAEEIRKALLLENNEDGDSFYQRYYLLLDQSGRMFRNPDLMLYMIVEFVNSTCHSVILQQQPVTLEELKPELAGVICDIIHRQEIR